MGNVYLVQHMSRIDGCDDVKIVGVYSSVTLAQTAVRRAADQPGFAAEPDGFSIDCYELDSDHWTLGFVRMRTIYMSLIDEGTDVWRPVLAEELENGIYRICGPQPEDESWQFAPGSLVKGEMRKLSGGTRMVACRIAGVA